MTVDELEKIAERAEHGDHMYEAEFRKVFVPEVVLGFIAITKAAKRMSDKMTKLEHEISPEVMDLFEVELGHIRHELDELKHIGVSLG